MIYLAELKDLIKEKLTSELADAFCVKLGYDYAVNTEYRYPDTTQEEFINANSHPAESYQYPHWKELKNEIAVFIKHNRYDELRLGQYIMEDILKPIELEVYDFYGGNPHLMPAISHDLVRLLLVENIYSDDPPKDLFRLHKLEIKKRFPTSDDFTEADQLRLIRSRCNLTQDVFFDRFRIPVFNEYRYFNIVFKRLACIIESNLLMNGCARDLFSYQQEAGVVLYPYLEAEDITEEMRIPKDLFSRKTQGYTCFDNYTEYAGYGLYPGIFGVSGVSFCGISEADALLMQTDMSKEPDYPKQHTCRNFVHFQEQCEAILDSSIPQEQKELKIMGIVHLLCHCYTFFRSEVSRYHLLSFAMSYLMFVQTSAIKATRPICFKRICQDLHYDNVITDPEPNIDIDLHFKRRRSKVGEPWIDNGLAHYLTHSRDFYENRLCGQCDRSECPFRKAKSQLIETEAPKEPPKQRKHSSQDFIDGYVTICEYMSKKSSPLVIKEKGSNHWRIKNSDQLYAFIGASLKRHFKATQIPWKTLLQYVHTDGSPDYLKELASTYKAAFEKKDSSVYPNGYILVEDAIKALGKKIKKTQ